MLPFFKLSCSAGSPKISKKEKWLWQCLHLRTFFSILMWILWTFTVSRCWNLWHFSLFYAQCWNLWHFFLFYFKFLKPVTFLPLLCWVLKPVTLFSFFLYFSPRFCQQMCWLEWVNMFQRLSLMSKRSSTMDMRRLISSHYVRIMLLCKQGLTLLCSNTMPKDLKSKKSSFK